jgi:hypothetical protein
MFGESLVTTAWRVLGLLMKGWPLKKQPRTTDKGWSSSLGVGRKNNVVRNPLPEPRWGKMHDEELLDIYSSPRIIRINKSRRMGLQGT